MQSKSKTSNLLKCLNDCTRIIDSGNPVDILYLDAAKAFDSVSHAKLIFNVTKWFENFLLYRKECVRVVRSGISQGTILGPILFILFINDVTRTINDSASLKNYTDDMKIYGTSSSQENRQMIQEDIDKRYRYLNDWQLKLNPLKSEVIYLGFSNVRQIYNVDGRYCASGKKYFGRPWSYSFT